MKAKVVMTLSAALIAGSLIAAPVTTFAGDAKAKCEAKAKKKNIAAKDMDAFMKKCLAKNEKKAEQKK